MAKNPEQARLEAEQARAQAEADAEAARVQAAADERAALEKAALAEQRAEVGTGKFVVLDSALVARTSKEDKSATRRYGRGETFEPVNGVHDVDKLVALGTLGKVGGKEPLRPSTALSKAQAAARYYQEDSPVLDLTTVPFEQNQEAAAQTL